MSTKAIGDRAEQTAADFLKKKGYSILESNYRFKRAEIDLIVKKDELIAFVEVKYRANSKFGYPESFVNDKKAELIGLAATHYCEDFATRLLFRR